MNDWDAEDPDQVIRRANAQIKLSEIFKERRIFFQETYHQKGWTHRRTCPFPDHKEAAPSFFFNPQENRFHCFGCNRDGNSVQFLAYLERKNPFIIAKKLLQQTPDGYQPNTIVIEDFSEQYEIRSKLFTFSSLFYEWCQKYPDKEHLAHNVMLVLEMYLKNNLPQKKVTLKELESRIQFCQQKLKEFECLEKF